MALDLMHADAVTDTTPAGLVTSGGTDSILHAMLAYREHAAQQRGIDGSTGGPTSSSRRPRTRRSTRPARLLGIELRIVPVDPATTVVDPERDGRADRRQDHRDHRVGLQLRLRHDRPDRRARPARPRPRRRPARRRLPGRLHPPVRRGARLRHPAVRLPGARASPASRPTPTSTATRSRARRRCCSATRRYRNAQYFDLVGWSGGKYMSPGIEGSRSGGLLAATWAAMVQYGREGYLEHARDDLRDGRADEGGGALPPRAADHRRARRSASASPPTTSTSTTSPTSCGSAAGASTASSTRTRSTWRSPGRRPGPGSPTQFAADLAEAVRVRRRRRRPPARQAFSGAIYGGVAGGLTDEVEEFIVAVMTDMLDTQQSVPPRTRHDRPGRAVRARGRPRHRRPQGRAGRPPRGEIAWWEHRAVAHDVRRPAGAATQDAERVVAAGGRRHPARAGRVRDATATQVVAVAVTGQWASTVPVDERGVPGRRLPDVDGHPGRDLLARGRRAGRCQGYDPVALATWVRRTGGRAVDHAATTRSATCSTSSTTQPDVARAARWYLEPVDYLTMRFTGVAAASPHVDDGGLAHRQPPPRRPGLRRRRWSGWPGVDGGEAAAAGRVRAR